MNETTGKPNISWWNYFCSVLKENGKLMVPPYYWSRLGKDGELLVPKQITVVSVWSAKVSATCTMRELVHRPAIKLVHDIQKVFESLELSIKKYEDSIAVIPTNMRFVEWEPNLWYVMYNSTTIAEVKMGVDCGMCEMAWHFY